MGRTMMPGDWLGPPVQRVIEANQKAHVEHRDWERLCQQVRLTARTLLELSLGEARMGRTMLPGGDWLGTPVQRVIGALQKAHVEHRDWERLCQQVRLSARMMLEPSLGNARMGRIMLPEGCSLVALPRAIEALQRAPVVQQK